MTDVLRWGDLTRDELAELLPEAVVALATGATESPEPLSRTRAAVVLAPNVTGRLPAGHDLPVQRVIDLGR